MVVRQILVLFVLVRIQVGQQKKDPQIADLFLFTFSLINLLPEPLQ
jgi:hypothetical protein